MRWSTVNINRSCFKGGLFEGDQASFWQLLGEFFGVQLQDFATLRGGSEDQPGEIGNFARRFWRIARKVGNFTREIWKSRRSSTERVDTDLRM